MKKRVLRNAVAAGLALLMLFAFVPVSFAADPPDSSPAILDTNTPLFSALVDAGKTHADEHFYSIGEVKSWTGSLYLGSMGITDISGLKYCIGITSLSLNDNAGLTDISALDGSPFELQDYALKSLSLSGTGVTVLPGDLQMPELETIDLSHSSITGTGLEGFNGANCPKLKKIDLSYTGLTDASMSGVVWSNLNALETLDFSHCANLHNIVSLSSISTLKNLYLSYAGLTSLPTGLPGLSGMSSLNYLALNGYTPQNTAESKGAVMHIASLNLSALATLPLFKDVNSDNYVCLNISNTDVTDASFLNGCNGIKMLAWEYMDSAPAVFPTTATNLYYVNLSFDTTLGNSAIPSIAAIPSIHTHSTGMYYATLCISATGINDVSGLSPSAAAGLRTLYWQDMHTGTAGTSFNLSAAQAASLTGLTQITNLDLVNDMGLGNGVMTTIAGMDNVTTLGIGNCGITDLCGLSSKTNITSLAMGGNKITSIEPLRGMSNLNSLTMNSNYVSDLSPLSGKPISRIDCSQNYLDLTPNSADMQVLSALPASGSNKYYDYAFQITIHYNPNMTGVPSIADGTVYYEQSFTPPTVTSTDPAQSFIGWDANAADGTTHLDFQSGHAAAVTLPRPIYPSDDVPSNEITYTVVFGYNISASANNSGFGTVTGAGAYQMGTSVTLHATPNAGCHFVRWTENGSAVSTSADFTFTVSGARSIVAVFEEDPKPEQPKPEPVNTVTLNSNGGTRTGGGELNQTLKNGSLVSAPEVSMAGYTLVGWFKEAACQNEWHFASDTVSSSMTLYAKWAKDYVAGKLPAKMAMGTQAAVKPSAAPKGYAFKSVAYSSGNPSVAIVNSSGVVTFIKGGKVKIAVKMIFEKVVKGKVITKTVTKTKSITVTEPVSSITLSQTNASLVLKKTLKLKAVVGSPTATNKKVTWKSSDTKIASVSGSGVVKAKGKGTVTITCTAKDGSGVNATCVITVN